MIPRFQDLDSNSVVVDKAGLNNYSLKNNKDMLFMLFYYFSLFITQNLKVIVFLFLLFNNRFIVYL